MQQAVGLGRSCVHRPARAASSCSSWLYESLPVITASGHCSGHSQRCSFATGRHSALGLPRSGHRRLIRAAASAGPEDSQQAQPWSADDLARLNEEVEAGDEVALGAAWRQLFSYDLRSLTDYAEWDEEEWAQVLQQLEALPKSGWEGSRLPVDAASFSPALANKFIGMGTWRLRHVLDPVITYLAARIEGNWREAFVEDLMLYPRSKWGAYEMCDSMDPKRELEGWSYADVPSPQKGEEGWPRLLIENRVYSSRVFRKLHMELAWRQDGLEVLHVVLYPRYAVDLPILAMDLVVSKGQVTLAIIDACPVRKNQQLPAHYLQTMTELQEALLVPDGNPRRIPDWGAAIFSPACVCIRPSNGAELVGFMRYAVALHRAHCALANLVQPLDAGDARQRVRLEDLLAGHKRFVDNQLANTKTSRVLESAFGEEWTQQYMKDVMFDYCPGEEPPVEDPSLMQLWDYFEEWPEMGSRPQEWADLQRDVAIERAEDTLTALVTGGEVRQDNVEKALMALFVHDQDFQDNCCLLLPELRDVPLERVGAFLADNLEALGLGESVKRWTASGLSDVDVPAEAEPAQPAAAKS